MRFRLAILLFLLLHVCSGASAQRNGDLDDLEPCRPAAKLFLIFDKEKFGYIDANGKTIVPPKYRYGNNFSEGLALVYEDNSASFIDESGNVVIRTPFKRAEDFSEGRAAVQSGELWGYIDRSGATVVQPQFEHVWPFSEGLAGVDGRVIDLQGKVVIATIENGGDDFYGWFSSGLASLSGDPGFG
jgi:WG repeat protein